jgi:hypothetical protein
MISMRIVTGLFLFFIALTYQTNLVGQDTLSDLSLYQWKQHLPWQRARWVSQSDTKVYISTEWAIIELDKAERSHRFFTKIDGLAENGISFIKYSKETDLLFVIYANSNIDLIKKDGSIINLPLIKSNQNLIGDKKIYHVYTQANTAWISCGFGAVKLNLTTLETEITLFTPVGANSFVEYQGFNYIALEDGMYRVAITEPNPQDFSKWQKLGVADGWATNIKPKYLTTHNGEMYFASGKTVYSYDGTEPQPFYTDPAKDVVFISKEGEGLTMGFKKDFVGTVRYLATDGSFSEVQGTCDVIRPIYAIEATPKTFWFADDNDGFFFYDKNTNSCDRLSFNSPYQHRISNLAISKEGKLFVSTPGPPTGLAPQYSRDGVYTLQNENWERIFSETYPDLVPYECHLDMWRVAIADEGNEFYTGSWIGGLSHFNDGNVECFNQSNSTLGNAGAAGTNRTAIGGLDFDSDGNLWIANYSSPKPIAVRKPDGKLLHFTAPNNEVLQVTVDDNNYKWFILAFNAGILVFDSGQDLESTTDDRYRILNTSNTVLPTNVINAITVDQSGDVWVGTAQGVVSFECGSGVFDPSLCKGSKRIVKVNDFNGYLLETEDVKAIAVDGANRKWFGTTNGIFVQSASGDEQIANYSTTNSPLFDNTITSMAINPKNGEVFIGTEKGLVSFRGDATQGTKVTLPTTYAFPNPVRPDYVGPIAVYGVAENANIIITDASGQMIWKGKSNGGQAVWDGNDYTGRRAATGVYLVFATTSSVFDAPDAAIAKIVFIH